MGKGSSGSTTTTIDYAYNAGMLELSQEQQGWAREMFNMFRYGVTYDPNEKEDSSGLTLGESKGYNADDVTSEMEYLQNMVDANQSLLGLQTGAQKKRIGLYNTYIDDINEGIDVNARMDEAQASVQHGFKNANKAARMDIESYGLDPGAGRYKGLRRDLAMAEATGVAGARTTAKNLAEQEDFQRKTVGLQIS